MPPVRTLPISPALSPDLHSTLPPEKAVSRMRMAAGIRTLITGDAPGNLMKLVEVAPLASKHAWMTRQVCGGLSATAEACFGRYAPILGLIEPSLRQVILTCLSEIWGSPEAFSREDRTRFAADAFTLSPKELLSSIFRKPPPPGLVRIISALGEAPRPPLVYKAIWDILTRQPDLARPLAHYVRHDFWTDEEVLVLAELPPHPDALAIMQAFDDADDFRNFRELFSVISGRSPDCADLALIGAGANPATLLRKAYHAVPFPAPPALPGLEDRLAFLPDGRALIEASKRLENCARNYVAEALSGKIIFYTIKGEVEGMLSLEREAAAFGLRLKDVKGRANSALPSWLGQELESSLRRCGVRSGLSVEDHLSILTLGEGDDDDDPGPDGNAEAAT